MPGLGVMGLRFWHWNEWGLGSGGRSVFAAEKVGGTIFVEVVMCIAAIIK